MSTKEEKLEWKHMLKTQALCTCCKKQDAYTLAGHWHCFECSQKDIIRARKRRASPEFGKAVWAKRKQQQWQWRSEGKCFVCGKPLTGSYKTCEKCRAKRAAYKRQRTQKDWVFDKGVCTRCHKRPAKEGFKLCEQCYAGACKSLAKARSMCDRKNHPWKLDETMRRIYAPHNGGTT